MNIYSTTAELRAALAAYARPQVSGDGLAIADPERFREEIVDGLVWTAVFGPAETRDAARHAIRESAEALGILPASILPLYEARGRGEVSGFTVPAINVRMMSYDTARAACRAARELSAGAVIFEIARSEMGYTEQRPAEYAAVLLAAAIRERWEGPFFLQGDHFQTNPKKMKENAEAEIQAIEQLIEEAIPAGFFQIDIDTSTLVDLSKPTLEEQQRVNADLCARFTKFIRTHQPPEMPISVGGEIGEVGKENSTPEEFRAYMSVYRRAIGDARGISKVSVQTGSSHGGVVAPDGSVERVSIDFSVLKSISKVARAGSRRSPSRRAPRTAGWSRRMAPSSASRSTSPSSRGSRRSRARSTAWPARSSTAPRRCRRNTSATSRTTTAPRSTSRPTS